MPPLSKTEPKSAQKREEFQTNEVLTIVGGHFVHDTFSAFLAPVLPFLIGKLSLSYASAGSLQFFVQLPALLNPFIGYLADKVSLRYFIILAPAITASLMSLIGLVPSYAILALILLLTGISIACFHAPAPAMVARISGHQMGKGMSWFMASGELGRTLGPVVLAWSVATWGLSGMYRVMVFGWLASVILYWRLRHVPARMDKPQALKAMLPKAWRVFLPLFGITFPRAFLLVPLQVYLPTLMGLQGASLWGASLSLTVWELAGVGGALLGGTLSDRFGRRNVLLVALSVPPMLTLVFLQVSGVWFYFFLALHGIFALSTNPVLLAIVQEHLPRNRAVANGLFMTLTFLNRPLVAVIIGFLADNFGLRLAYLWGAIIAFLSLPAVFFLPPLEATSIEADADSQT